MDSSPSSAFEHCPYSNGHSGGLDESCGLQKVARVASHLFLQRCSMGPLLRSCFSEEEVELQNMLWGLRAWLTWAVFRMQP